MANIDGDCMKVSEKFRTQYLNYLKSYLPLAIIQNEQFTSVASADLDSLIELSTVEVCEARKKKLALDCNADDIAERVLVLSNGDEVIAGVRFNN